jgi:hypothetical protein
MKRVTESVSAVARARSKYASIAAEWEKALLARERDREVVDRGGTLDTRQQRGHNRRAKDEVELRAKVEDARQVRVPPLVAALKHVRCALAPTSLHVPDPTTDNVSNLPPPFFTHTHTHPHTHTHTHTHNSTLHQGVLRGCAARKPSLCGCRFVSTDSCNQADCDSV